jgi:glycine cleavage system regulatory protein
MTIIGKDRPGLVELVARIVASHGGNWLESRMSHLGGQFAGLLRVHVPPDQEGALVQALQGLGKEGLTVVIHTDLEPAPTRVGKLMQLELVGQDRPGIVRQISQVLASQGVNVEELHTECVSAPMSGETLFKARARLQLPASCDLQTLRHSLEEIAADLMVELALAEWSGEA